MAEYAHKCAARTDDTHTAWTIARTNLAPDDVGSGTVTDRNRIQRSGDIAPAVHASAPAPKRNRRSCGLLKLAQSVRAGVPFVQRLLWPKGHAQSETIRQELDPPSGGLGVSRCNRSPTSSESAERLRSGREAYDCE